MHRSAAVNRAIDKLFEVGVLKESVLQEFGQLLERLEAFSKGLVGTTPASRRRRPERKAGRPKGKARNRKRSKLTATDAQLRRMYVDQGMTAKQIAKKYGVSAGTVAVRASNLGLKKRAGGGAKKASKKAAIKKKLQAGRKKATKK